MAIEMDRHTCRNKSETIMRWSTSELVDPRFPNPTKSDIPKELKHADADVDVDVNGVAANTVCWLMTILLPKLADIGIK